MNSKARVPAASVDISASTSSMPETRPSARGSSVNDSSLPPAKAMLQHVSSVERWAERTTEMLEAGAPPTAIYDRLRLEHGGFGGSLSAVKRLCMGITIRAAFGMRDEPVLNRSYRDLARHFGFKIDPTPAYGPSRLWRRPFELLQFSTEKNDARH